MSYPESANVSAGDATLATHYNNLRADAVHLGQVAADSVDLGTLLERYESRLAIERLDTNKLRIVASAVAPVSLLIDGYLCQAVANVDLDAGEVPSGAANVFYIFANRTDSSTTFTLTVSLTSTEDTNKRRIGRFYWDGSKIIKDSVRSELAGLIADLLYLKDPQVCGGRLTLSTGVPVPVADISSSANVYFSPYHGDRISLYVNDYGWRVYSFSELTLDISGVADAKMIDVWLYDNAGTLTHAYTEWSNDSLRATALVRQDGVLVKSGAPEYRYLGSVRTSGAGVTADTLLKRFIWNNYNRVVRELHVHDIDAHLYETETARYFANDDTNKVELIIGVHEDVATIFCYVEDVEGGIIFFPGIDEIPSPAPPRSGVVRNSSTALGRFSSIGTDAANFDIGYHYVAMCEYGLAGGTVDEMCMTVLLRG